MRKVERAILAALVGGAMVFMCGLAIVGCTLSSEMTPRPATSTPRPTPSPSPTIDTHLYDGMCAVMRSLDLQRQAIRTTIEANEDFIRRTEIAFRQGVLSEQDRQKAHDLKTELDLHVDPFLDDMMEILLKEPRKNPKQLGEIGEWAKESAAIFNYLANEIEYFTTVGEERRQWQTQEIVNTQITVNEYIRRALLQDSVYEQLMERYCQ